MDIAELAGVSRQVFYQHFRDRNDVVATAVAASYHDMNANGGRADEDPSSVIHRLCDFAAQHSPLYRNLHPSAASQQTADAYRVLLRPACVRLVEDLLAARGRRGDAVTTAALADFVLGGIVEVGRLRVETPAPGEMVTADDPRGQVVVCLTALGLESPESTG